MASAQQADRRPISLRHVASMLRGAAHTKWEALKILANFLQHDATSNGLFERCSFALSCSIYLEKLGWGAKDWNLGMAKIRKSAIRHKGGHSFQGGAGEPGFP